MTLSLASRMTVDLLNHYTEESKQNKMMSVAKNDLNLVYLEELSKVF
jgi:hypothetical protein